MDVLLLDSESAFPVILKLSQVRPALGNSRTFFSRRMRRLFYLSNFGAPAHFSQPLTRVVFDASYLSLPTIRSEQVLKGFLRDALAKWTGSSPGSYRREIPSYIERVHNVSQSTTSPKKVLACQLFLTNV